MASTYEVTVVRARMPKSRAVLASIYVDGDVIGRTSRRRRVREPVWDRTFGLEVAEDKSLQTKVVFQEQVNNAASIVGTVELDGRELCAKTGEWRGWIKERKTISLISHRFAALIELRLAKPGEGPSPRAQICAVEDDDGCGNDQIIVDVTRARSLAKESKFAQTATYCEVHYGGALIGVTRVVKGSLSPEWNGNFHYALSYGGRPCSLKNKNKKLVVRVMNRHKTAEDTFLGEVSIPKVNQLGKDDGAVRRPRDRPPFSRTTARGGFAARRFAAMGSSAASPLRRHGFIRRAPLRRHGFSAARRFADPHILGTPNCIEKQWYRLTAGGEERAVVSGDVQVAVRFDAAFENDEQARPPGVGNPCRLAARRNPRRRSSSTTRTRTCARSSSSATSGTSSTRRTTARSPRSSSSRSTSASRPRTSARTTAAARPSPTPTSPGSCGPRRRPTSSRPSCPRRTGRRSPTAPCSPSRTRAASSTKRGASGRSASTASASRA